MSSTVVIKVVNDPSMQGTLYIQLEQGPGRTYTGHVIGRDIQGAVLIGLNMTRGETVSAFESKPRPTEPYAVRGVAVTRSSHTWGQILRYILGGVSVEANFVQVRVVGQQQTG